MSVVRLERIDGLVLHIRDTDMNALAAKLGNGQPERLFFAFSQHSKRENENAVNNRERHAGDRQEQQRRLPIHVWSAWSHTISRLRHRPGLRMSPPAGPALSSSA